MLWIWSTYSWFWFRSQGKVRVESGFVQSQKYIYNVTCWWEHVNSDAYAVPVETFANILDSTADI